MGAGRKILGGLGKGLKIASPLLALTGVGIPAAALAGAAGGALERGAKGGFNLRNVATGGTLGGLYGGAGGYGVSRLAGGETGMAGLRHLGGSVKEALVGRATAGRNLQTGDWEEGRTRGLLQRAGGFLRENPELVLGGINAGLQAREGARQDALRRDLMGLIQARMNEGAGLRSQAAATLSQGMPPMPALDADFADPTNPFYRKRQVA